MTHTPGPWHTKDVIGLPDEEFTAIMTANEDEEVCIMPRSSSMANKCLVAAAPALLEVSEKAEALILKQQIDGTTFEECAEFLDEVRAAIAQAKGG